MMIRLLYFARLREILGDGETLQLPADGDIRINDMLNHLRARGGKWQKELASGNALAFAVNQTIAAPESVIPPDAEVAIFPPVTGG